MPSVKMPMLQCQWQRMPAIGGIGSIQGPICGTLIFFLMREWLSDYGSWYQMVMGLVAIIVMIQWP